MRDNTKISNPLGGYVKHRVNLNLLPVCQPFLGSNCFLYSYLIRLLLIDQISLNLLFYQLDWGISNAAFIREN